MSRCPTCGSEMTTAGCFVCNYQTFKAYPQPLSPPPMTLREHYAGLAMKSLIAKDYTTLDICAAYAVKMADALIAALEKTK